jgi:hypothetical protein
VITVLFSHVIMLKMGYIKAEKLRKVANIGIWVMFIFFILNTIANLTSGVTVENLTFAPITILLALLTLRLAIEK